MCIRAKPIPHWDCRKQVYFIIILSTMQATKPEKTCSYEARINLPHAWSATIVAEAVSVDPELRPDQVTRQLTVHDSAVLINVTAMDAKMLRTAVTSLYDFIRVSIHALATVPR